MRDENNIEFEGHLGHFSIHFHVHLQHGQTPALFSPIPFLYYVTPFVSKRYICSCSQFDGVYNCLLPQLVESTINLVFQTQILGDKKLAKK